ncbi:4-hydroxybenzoate polyprenyltransferase [Amycolatopsis marina]|uniref:4-hydroxybenzoate polyprenyltransferase n=1 Tax=Amycolatopsis marina TaxID=490629 RepID=A0A1I0WYM1_9PSEU|nr:UbiA family prenyltransferase [Amycolatopsis marina]SFA93839.1 4-hydroxybenzoate polyprenyltransferase [Amycolatopsis marina]
MPGLTRTPTRGLWGDLVVLHRLEHPLPVMYVCYASWGACYATGDVRGLLHPPVLLAILANLLLLIGGLALNNIVDVPTDRQHKDKAYLSSAALRVGEQKALWLALTETAAGLILSIVVSVVTGRWIVAAMALGIALLHVLYNVRPVRLKGRGLAGSIAFGLSVVALPSLLSHGAVSQTLPGWVLAVLAGASVLAVGRTVWWSAPDRAADLISGVATPAARYGVPRTLVLSCLILLSGLVLLGGGLWAHFGFVTVVAGALAHAVFTGTAVFQLLRATRGIAPTASAMRRHALLLVLAGELSIALVPLLAS